MKFLGKAIYRGPNIFSNTPLVGVRLDLEKLEDWPCNKIDGFNEKLLTLLPSLHTHGCSYGTDGGFILRLDEGTWMGHIIEHVAIELQNLAGSPVARGKTRAVRGHAGVYNVLFEYETEDMGFCAGRLAIELVNSLLPADLQGLTGFEELYSDDAGSFISVAAAVDHLREIAARENLGPTTGAIAAAAKRRGIPVMRLDGDSLVQLGTGKYRKCIRGSITDLTSAVAMDTACDKALTKRLLEEAGIPVPCGSVVETEEEALEAARDIGYPLAVKPLDGNQGKGITTCIISNEQLREAFAIASRHGKSIIVERHYDGRDYRVLVIAGQVIAVAEREAAHVTGDGKHTISELISHLNADPSRGNGHEYSLTKVVIDDQLERYLEKTNRSLASVPALGERVRLRGTANLSTGGTAIDRTDDIHPSNISLMERAVRAIGLDVAGIDVIAEDISKPMTELNGAVLEVNAAPGLRMHLNPSQGRARAVGEAVVSTLFHDGCRSSIPIAAITGTNGKSTTARMVSHILRQHNYNVGLTSTSGIYVNDERIWKGDASGPRSARVLLRDSAIDYAVLEVARGGILREGLPFETCDVGAVLNISADHLGLGGVETLEDLAEVKSLVVKMVAKGGTSVLNADDSYTRDMAGIAGGNICFFSMQGLSPFLREHIQGNGTAVVCESWAGGLQLAIYAEGRRMAIINADQIPATLEGVAAFNIQNALAAAAISAALGLDVKAIRTGLSTFTSSFEQNPGRLNVYDGHGFRVIVDYGHNPAALTALLDGVDRMRGNYRRVIGTVSTPGDRQDEHIREMGRIAAGGFDFLVFRERPDARGRPDGEVVRLMAEGARAAGFPKENMVCVYPEEEAIDICLQKALPGDLVVLMPTNVEMAWQRMVSFKPDYAELPASVMQHVRQRVNHV